MLNRLWKPWFIYRPTQMVQRAACEWKRPIEGYHPLPVAWGLEIIADPGKTIGHSIWTTGIYDLAVSEVIARLVQSGDLVIDAGANVGYMTLLARVAASPNGQVIGFEPHPDLCRIAADNIVASSRKFELAAAEIRNQALGEASGQADLVVPAAFDKNDGLARIGAAKDAGDRTLPVEVTTVDDVVGSDVVGLLKLDVEGHEYAILKGARQALINGQIRHIVFDNHDGTESGAVALLQEHGYSVFAIGWSMRGLRLAPLDSGSLAASYEALSCLATLQPAEALASCGEKGWQTLSRGLLRRRVRRTVSRRAARN
jgi:FkbM family methyltransferase